MGAETASATDAVTGVVLVVLWGVAAAGLWWLTARMAAGPEQVPAAFRAVLWIVKGVAVLVAAHASGAALLGGAAWLWTLAVAVLLLGSAARFETLRRTARKPGRPGEPAPALMPA